jgi:hypothetical protein
VKVVASLDDWTIYSPYLRRHGDLAELHRTETLRNHASLMVVRCRAKSRCIRC